MADEEDDYADSVDEEFLEIGESRDLIDARARTRQRIEIAWLGRLVHLHLR